MTKCQFCHKGLNSSYIRVGAKEYFKKVGLYCIACDMHYSPDLSKQYTVKQKEYAIQSTENPYYFIFTAGPVGLVIDILRV